MLFKHPNVFDNHFISQSYSRAQSALVHRVWVLKPSRRHIVKVCGKARISCARRARKRYCGCTKTEKSTKKRPMERRNKTRNWNKQQKRSSGTIAITSTLDQLVVGRSDTICLCAIRMHPSSSQHILVIHITRKHLIIIKCTCTSIRSTEFIFLHVHSTLSSRRRRTEASQCSWLRH